MAAGDFNVTLNMEERSNADYPIHHMNRFRAVINEVGLTDISMQGRTYTWSRGRDNPTFARLDRFMLNSQWTALFPNTTQIALASGISDHCPIQC